MNHKGSLNSSLVVMGIDPGTAHIGVSINRDGMTEILNSPITGDWSGHTYQNLIAYFFAYALPEYKVGLICIEQAFHSFKGDNSTAICSALIECAAASSGLSEANIKYFSPQGWRALIGYEQPHHYSETENTKAGKPKIRKATPTEKKYDKMALATFIRARLQISGGYSQDQIEAAGIAEAGRIWAEKNVEVER